MAQKRKLTGKDTEKPIPKSVSNPIKAVTIQSILKQRLLMLKKKDNNNPSKNNHRLRKKYP